MCVCVCVRGFPVGSVVNNLPASAEDGVRSLLWEDPVCYRAAKLMYSATTEPVLWSPVTLLKPTALESMLHNRSHRNEKPTHCN